MSVRTHLTTSITNTDAQFLAKASGGLRARETFGRTEGREPPRVGEDWALGVCLVGFLFGISLAAIHELLGEDVIANCRRGCWASYHTDADFRAVRPNRRTAKGFLSRQLVFFLDVLAVGCRMQKPTGEPPVAY